MVDASFSYKLTSIRELICIMPKYKKSVRNTREPPKRFYEKHLPWEFKVKMSQDLLQKHDFRGKTEVFPM